MNTVNATLRVQIGNSLYRKIIHCVESGGYFRLHDQYYTVTGASRLDQTDYVRVELTKANVLWR
jgi:hypothetical protein